MSVVSSPYLWRIRISVQLTSDAILASFLLTLRVQHSYSWLLTFGPRYGSDFSAQTLRNQSKQVSHAAF